MEEHDIEVYQPIAQEEKEILKKYFGHHTMRRFNEIKVVAKDKMEYLEPYTEQPIPDLWAYYSQSCETPEELRVAYQNLLDKVLWHDNPPLKHTNRPYHPVLIDLVYLYTYLFDIYDFKPESKYIALVTMEQDGDRGSAIKKQYNSKMKIPSIEEFCYWARIKSHKIAEYRKDYPEFGEAIDVLKEKQKSILIQGGADGTIDKAIAQRLLAALHDIVDVKQVQLSGTIAEIQLYKDIDAQINLIRDQEPAFRLLP